MWKICIRKILNINLIYFNSLNSVITEFPISKLYVYNILSLQKMIEPHVFVLSIPQFVWQDLAISCKSLKGEKSMYDSLEFNEWTEGAIQEAIFSQVYFNLLSTALEQLFFKKSPSSYLKINKNRCFVQYNDERKMLNAHSEITKSQHNWINANSKAKPLRVKYTIEMIIFK